MINYLLLALSTLAVSAKALLCKSLGVGGYSAKQTILLNCRSFFVAFACSLLFVLHRLSGLFAISLFSLVLSVFFGLSIAATQILQAKAMGNGPASMVTMIYSCGFLLPIFYGLVFWEERVSVFQWLGIGLLVVVLCLSVEQKGKKGTLFKWLPFAVATMLGSGANAIFQKTHQYSAFAEELPFFLVYSLLFSAIFTGVASLIIREKRDGEPPAPKNREKKKIWVPLCLGVCVGVMNFLNLYLAAKLPSAILFPVCNVGSMLLTSMISAVVYRDIPTKKQGIGFAIGIVALLMIGLS